MKRNTTLRALLALMLSMLGCAVLFGCGHAAQPEPPKVENVTLTAVEGPYGKTGTVHRVDYTATEGAKVSLSVERGDAPATANDYAGCDGELIFHTPGDYTVTVYAAKDGMQGSGKASIHIEAAEELYVRDVAVAGADAYTGKVGGLHLIRYTVPAGCEVEVTFTKDGEAAAADFDSTYGIVVFPSAGNYTVTVTARRGEATASSSAEIAVVALDAPVVGLTASKGSVAEDEAVVLTHSVQYAAVDRADSEELSVLYRRGSGEYQPAEEETYTLLGERFVPRVAGSWRLVYTATGAWGTEGAAQADVTCTPAPIELAPVTDGPVRLAVGQKTEIPYHVAGAVDKYDVSFDVHGKQVTAEAGAGHAVAVTASDVDWFTVTVVYSHKTAAGTRETLDLTCYTVEDLTAAPVLGEDPFDGMPDEVLTNMGHLLYIDVKGYGTPARALSATDAKFEIVSQSLSVSSSKAEILLAGNNEAYPYLFLNNLDDGVAKGSFTLRMTVTDPYTGYAAVAEKDFTVVPTGNSNSSSPVIIADHVRKYRGFYDMDSFDFAAVLGHDVRLNTVLTKTGAIINRVSLGSLNNGNQLAQLPFGGTPETSRLAFRFTPIALDGAIKLGIGVRTGNKNGWVGYIDLSVAGGSYSAECGFGTSNTASIRPAAEVGRSVLVYVDRTVVGDLALFTLSIVGEDGPLELLRTTAPRSSSQGNAGAPVAAYQFDFRAAGCFAVEDVALSELL